MKHVSLSWSGKEERFSLEPRDLVSNGNYGVQERTYEDGGFNYFSLAPKDLKDGI